MPSIISAGTTTGTALSLTSDTSGELQIRTNNGATTAMTLTTGGNVGIGTSSPSAKLDIDGGFIQADTAGTATGRFGSSTYITTGSGTDLVIQAVQAGSNTVFVGGSTERMRIDSAGNVGIGTSSPTSRLHVESSANVTGQIKTTATTTVAQWQSVNSAGGNINLAMTGSGYSPYGVIGATNGYIYSGSDIGIGSEGIIKFGAGGGIPERMRIDSSGNLLVGTTSADAKVTIKGSTADSSQFAVYIRNSSNTGLGGLRNDGNLFLPLVFNNTSASAANVGITTSGEFFRSTSSIKYKTDVQNATYGLAEVMQLRPVTYKGKRDGNTIFGGLIAEEVHEAGLSEFVQYADDGSPDALAYGSMVSLAFKAIQEQQALIQNLTTRLNALEGK